MYLFSLAYGKRPRRSKVEKFNHVTESLPVILFAPWQKFGQLQASDGETIINTPNRTPMPKFIVRRYICVVTSNAMHTSVFV